MYRNAKGKIKMSANETDPDDHRLKCWLPFRRPQERCAERKVEAGDNTLEKTEVCEDKEQGREVRLQTSQDSGTTPKCKS